MPFLPPYTNSVKALKAEKAKMERILLLQENLFPLFLLKIRLKMPAFSCHQLIILEKEKSRNIQQYCV